MSKSETSVVRMSDLTSGVDKLYAGIDKLVASSTSKTKFAKLVAVESSRQQLASTLAIFSNVDAKFEGGMKNIGKLCVAIKKLDEHAQILVINEIAKINGIQPTKDTGNKGLAYALFGKFPEMMKASGKDTIAGKRIASYIMAVKGTRGKPKPRQVGPGSTPPATPENGNGTTREPMPAGAETVNGAADLFVTLYNVATEKEQEVLVSLAQRAKIEYEDWIDFEDAE